MRQELTAQPIMDGVEEVDDYAALAAAINTDFRPAMNFKAQFVA